nr:hypothetical protein [Tanacetum cinerariifolium]
MQEGNVDTGKALDAGLVVTERSGTESRKQDTSSRSRNDTYTVNAYIRSVYDKEPMAEVQLNAEHNVLANGKQHVELLEFNNEGRVDQDAVQCQVKSPLLNDELFKMKYMVEKERICACKTPSCDCTGSSRNSSKESNLKPREMSSAKTHHTTNTCTPKPRSNNQMSKNWPASRISEETLKVVQKADHSRNPSSFSDSKYFVCSTCQKCVFNANYDACITKFIKKVNSRIKVQSPKTRNNNKRVKRKIHTQKPGRQSVTGHRFSPNKSYVVHGKINTPRSCLRWILTGRIFNPVGLKLVPTEKIFTSSTTKVDCELPNGSNEDITNPYKCNQTLNVSACTFNLNNTSGPAPQRKERYMLQRALSLAEEKSSCFPPFSSTFFIFSYARSVIIVDEPVPEVIAPIVEVIAPKLVESTGSPSSTTADQDAPSASNSQLHPNTITSQF